MTHPFVRLVASRRTALLLLAASMTACASSRTEPVEIVLEPAEAPETRFSQSPGPAQQAMFVGLYGEVNGASPAMGSDGVASISQISFGPGGADFDPDVDRDAGFVAFASTQHSATSDIYRKSITGTTVTQLTNDPSDDMMPAISPDGASIAFASMRGGNWDIYVMPADGGRPMQITSDTDHEFHPTWSPDGSKLAFSRLSSRTDQWEIWVIDVENPSVRHYLTQGVFPQWSPDAADSRILFQKPRYRDSRLYGIWTIKYQNGEGVHPTEIVSAANAAALHPCWSPDGRRVAFAVIVEPESQPDGFPDRAEIWAVNVDGSGRMPVVEGNFRNVQPEWGADGRIYFVSNRGGKENIWAVAPASMGRPRGAMPASQFATVPVQPEAGE